MNNLKVSLFMPVYNAFRYIPHSLNEAYRCLSECCDQFEIVIVDDTSTDQTAQFIQDIERAEYPSDKVVRVIRNQNGPSRRENLAKAFATAHYNIIGFIDVDLSFGMEYLTQAIQLMLSESVDIVIGSRYVRGAKVTRELSRRTLSFFYNLTIRVLFGSRIYDHQCGLKIFRKSVAERICQEMGYDAAFQRGWFWDAEFLIRAQKDKLVIREMPVVWRYARTSTFHFFRELKCIGSMLRLRVALSPFFRKRISQ